MSHFVYSSINCALLFAEVKDIDEEQFGPCRYSNVRGVSKERCLHQMSTGDPEVSLRRRTPAQAFTAYAGTGTPAQTHKWA